MIAEQAHILGARCISLDPAPDAPAFAVCDEHIVAAFDDAAALEELCRRSDVATYEIENVPSELLVGLERKYDIRQGFRPLFDSQDRLREKDNARAHGLRTVRYAAADDGESLRRAVDEVGIPCVVKTRTLGYDGHGQAVVRGAEDMVKAAALLPAPLIVEEFIEFDYEASAIVVADGVREICFPVGRNIHKGGILDLCVVPCDDAATGSRIARASCEFMRSCGYRGILAIEYFVRDGEIYFNEMAPRPHNSGHYTIEGCTTNQFRELCRYLLGLPLEEPRLLAPTVMKNILGCDAAAAERIAALGLPNVHVHMYGKSLCKPLRKMGHITFTDMTAERYGAEWADKFVR